MASPPAIQAQELLEAVLDERIPVEDVSRWLEPLAPARIRQGNHPVGAAPAPLSWPIESDDSGVEGVADRAACSLPPPAVFVAYFHARLREQAASALAAAAAEAAAATAAATAAAAGHSSFAVAPSPRTPSVAAATPPPSSVAGPRAAGGCAASGLAPTSLRRRFDIASADDFPSLGPVPAPRTVMPVLGAPAPSPAAVAAVLSDEPVPWAAGVETGPAETAESAARGPATANPPPPHQLAGTPLSGSGLRATRPGGATKKRIRPTALEAAERCADGDITAVPDATPVAAAGVWGMRLSRPAVAAAAVMAAEAEVSTVRAVAADAAGIGGAVRAMPTRVSAAPPPPWPPPEAHVATTTPAEAGVGVTRRRRKMVAPAPLAAAPAEPTAGGCTRIRMGAAGAEAATAASAAGNAGSRKVAEVNLTPSSTSKQSSSLAAAASALAASDADIVLAAAVAGASMAGASAAGIVAVPDSVGEAGAGFVVGDAVSASSATPATPTAAIIATAAAATAAVAAASTAKSAAVPAAMPPPPGLPAAAALYAFLVLRRIGCGAAGELQLLARLLTAPVVAATGAATSVTGAPAAAAGSSNAPKRPRRITRTPVLSTTAAAAPNDAAAALVAPPASANDDAASSIAAARAVAAGPLRGGWGDGSGKDVVIGGGGGRGAETESLATAAPKAKTAAATAVAAAGAPMVPVFLRSGTDCRAFAAAALARLVPLLEDVGPHVTAAFASCPALVAEAPDLTQRLAAAARWQQRLGHGGVSGSTGGKAGSGDTSGVGENHGTAGGDDAGGAAVTSSAAPAWREGDSWSAYRTVGERRSFQNRQRCLDDLSGAIHEYQGRKRGLGDLQRPRRALRQRATELLAAVERVNLRWLADLFVHKLLAVGLSPTQETDTEVIALVAPSRLQSLQRRLEEPSLAAGVAVVTAAAPAATAVTGAGATVGGSSGAGGGEGGAVVNGMAAKQSRRVGRSGTIRL
ncbi:unnamed protein product, partial [Phaeothamnion confervicola]